MEETTTTDAPVDNGASIQGVPVNDQGQAQPEPAEPAPAVEQPTVTTEAQPEAPSEPSSDEQLAKFAENKGLTLDSENAVKAAKMAMNAEKAMHQKAQKASELEKSVETISDEYAEETALNTGQDPEILKRVQRMEVTNQVRDFWNTPDASGNTPDKSVEPVMIELLKDKPHLAGDLEALYANALVKSGNLADVKSQGGREALESLAQKQQAAVPSGNAVSQGVSPSAITPDNVDSLVAQNNLEWFEKNRDAINKAMAG